MTTFGPAAILQARHAATSAGATVTAVTSVGNRLHVRVSCADDLEAIAFANPGALVEAGSPRRVQARLGGQRVTFEAAGA